MANIYLVSFKIGSFYHSNIALAENPEDVKAHYSEYEDVFVSDGNEGDLREAEKKGKPIITIEHKEAESMERTREEMQREVFDYAVKYWKTSLDMEELTDSEHINTTLELLEEDKFNDAREDEAEKIIETVKALRVDGSIGKKIAVYFNDANRCFFSDADLNEFAFDYNTDAETLNEMLNQLAEIIDDMRSNGYYAEEEIALYNEGREHLKTIA